MEILRVVDVGRSGQEAQDLPIGRGGEPAALRLGQPERLERAPYPADEPLPVADVDHEAVPREIRPRLHEIDELTLARRAIRLWRGPLHGIANAGHVLRPVAGR